MSESVVAKSGIYKIVNKANGKCYIGSAVHIATRWSGHKSRLSKGTHHSPKLQNAWGKYGSDSFVFEVVELVENKLDLIAAEQRWIDFVKPFYNIAPTAGSPLGVKQSDETRLRKSIAMRGFKHSEETLEKMRVAAKLRGIPEDVAAKGRAAAVIANKGRVLSESHLAALVSSRKGAKASSETRAKMSAASKGKPKAPFTDEHKRNISISASKRTHSLETIEKLSRIASERGAPVLTAEQRSAGDAKRRGVKRTEEQKQRMRDAWARRRELATKGEAFQK